MDGYFLNAFEHKINERKSRYGDYWKTASLDFLDQKLLEEIEEYKVAITNEQKMEELIDVSIMCHYLWKRIGGKIWV